MPSLRRAISRHRLGCATATAVDEAAVQVTASPKYSLIIRHHVAACRSQLKVARTLLGMSTFKLHVRTCQTPARSCQTRALCPSSRNICARSSARALFRIRSAQTEQKCWVSVPSQGVPALCSLMQQRLPWTGHNSRHRPCGNRESIDHEGGMRLSRAGHREEDADLWEESPSPCPEPSWALRVVRSKGCPYTNFLANYYY